MGKKLLKSRKRREQTIAIIIVSAVVLIVTALILVFAASQNSDFGEHDHDHDHAGMVNLKVSLAAGEHDIHYASVEKFKELVESKSDGEITVSIHGSEELGTGSTVLESIVREEEKAEIVITSVSDFLSLDARMDISAMPFLFNSYDEAVQFMNGSIQSEIAGELLKKNVNVLTYYTDGFDHLISNRTVSNPVDMTGLQIGTSDERQTTTIIKFFNAKHVLLQKNTVFQAFQNNECNAYMGSLDTMVKYHLYEKQKYVSMTYHKYNALAFAISDEVWDSLTEEQQNIVASAAKASAQQDVENMKLTESNAIKRMEGAGIRVIRPNRSAFVERAVAIVRGNQSKYGAYVERIISEYMK